MTLAKLKELYSLTMFMFGSCFTTGGGSKTGALTAGIPPVVPICSGLSVLPVSASFN